MSEVQKIPESKESEQAVLSCLLQFPEKSMDLCQERLTPDMFFNPGHRIIYEAILGLWNAERSTDPILLLGRLQEAKMLECAGGPGYLSQIQFLCPSATNLKSYLEILAECYHKRQLIKAFRRGEEAVYEGAEELSGAIKEVETAVHGWINGNNVSEIDRGSWFRTMEDMEVKYDQRQKGGFDKVLGISTGMKLVDRHDGGLKPNIFTLIAARPSQGKTRLLLQWLISAAQEGHKSLFFSLEMDEKAVIQSIFAQDGATDVDGAFEGYLREGDFPRLFKTAAAYRDLIFVDDTPALTVEQIRAKSKRFIAKHPDTKIIAIDHHLLIKFSRHNRNESEETLLKEISVGLSALRKELGVSLILLCQINRDGSKTRPRMSHIKGSGQFEADADNIWIIDMEDTEGETIRKGWLHKDKGRNSSIGSVRVRFNRRNLLFSEEESD